MDFAESHNNTLVDRLDLRPNDRLFLGHNQKEVFTVEQKLGKGGFGSVFSISNGTQVRAIKILHLWEMLKNEHKQLKERFEVEFVIGKIRSEYIVNTYSKGYLGGNPYITMEYCPNGSLYEKLGKFNNEDAYENITYRLLSGLEDLHSNNVIHRDIKPENLIFDSDDLLKITDFGISAYLNKRKTERGIFGNAKQAFGSVLYSPPEQLQASKAYKYTKATMDIYAAGVTMYYMLSEGKFPFGSFEDYKNDEDAYLQRKNQKRYATLQEVRPDLNPKWSYAIDKCLNPNPSDRFQTVKSLKQSLDLKLRSNQKSDTEWFKHNTLKIIGGEQLGILIDLDLLSQKKKRKLLRIGRKGSNEENDIPLIENYTSYISSKHATLECLNEDWYIRDGQFVNDADGPRWKNSTNGTLVNQTVINRLQSKKLQHGDMIMMGEFNLKFYRAMEK